MRLWGGLVLVAATLALVPASASAAIRYTTPTGSGSACSQASPCSLTQGVSGASAGDEVRLTADEYYLDSTLTANVANLTISGPPGVYAPSDSRAFIFFRTEAQGAPAGFDNDPKIRANQDNLTLSRLSIVGQAGSTSLINAINSDNLALERVLVFDDDSAFTVTAQDASVTNSVIRHTSSAIGGGTAMNVTGSITGSTITSATGNAIVNNNNFHDSNPPYFDYCNLLILNTISVGALTNLRTSDTGSSGCYPNIAYSYSWIPAAPGYGGGGIAPSGYITAGASNLADSPPALSAPLGGVFVLPPDSPAINAGCGGSCGVEDFYGRPRPIGSGNDIGAYEATLIPEIADGLASNVTSTTAQLSAVVNPNGGQSTYNFQIRRTGTSEWETVSGATLPADTNSFVPVTAEANLLEPETAYQVRIVAINSAGELAADGLAFRTLATPTPTPSASLSVNSVKVKVGKKGAYFTSRVTVNSAGSLAQTATTGSGKKTRTWCRTMTTARTAATYPLKCNLGSKGRRYLKKRSLALTVKTTLRAATGASATNTRKLTIKRRR
ncbi:MAG: fibronectin type III domain-containing protein [Solirubrobacteraceae bacterium]|nr:fibronectin type III domain-containing protein [Solirubrobacteraceae bacterium]